MIHSVQAVPPLLPPDLLPEAASERLPSTSLTEHRSHSPMARGVQSFQQHQQRHAQLPLPSQAQWLGQEPALQTRLEEGRFLRRQMSDDAHRVLEAGAVLSQDPALINTQAAPGFFDHLLDLISLIESDYLGIYEHVVQAYSALYKAFNERIMARMGEWITGQNEGKEVSFWMADLRRELNSLITEYGGAAGQLYPLNGGTDFESAGRWAQSLGLPDTCVIFDTRSRNWVVKMDLSPLETMLASLPPAPFPFWPDRVSWDSAKFQAWQTGFNSQEAEMKNQLQMLTSKYSNAHAYHDNFNKLLSTQLSQYADMLKAYVNF